MALPPTTPPPLPSALSGMTAALLRWQRRLATFTAGQAGVQVLAFVNALLVLRWMGEAEYAKTGVVLGFQTLCTTFVDLGVGGALVALIGRDGVRPAVAGAYLAAGRWWRRLLFVLVVPPAGAAFVALCLRQGWGLGESLVLLGCIALSLHAAALTALASAPLLLHHRLGAFYGSANGGALARLAGLLLLHQAGLLDAVSATALNTAVALGVAWACMRAARPHVDEPARAPAHERREILRYAAPLAPMAAFYALQGQVTTVLVATFGEAQHIAEVTALGRLGQLFAFLSALYSMLVLPYFARVPAAAFHRRYPAAVAATLALAAAIALLAFALPQPLLWLLGPRYAHLGAEVGWMVAASALAFASGALWCIHAARHWVFWSTSVVYVVAVTAVQAAWIAHADMGRTHDVVLLAVLANAAALACQGWVAGLGLRRDSAA